MQGLPGLDYGTYYFFSHQFKPDSLLFSLFQSLRFLGNYWMVGGVALAAVLVALKARRFRLAISIAAFFVVAVGIGEGLNLATQRPRPNEARHLIAAQNMASSFPSRSVLMSTYSWLALALALESTTIRKRLRYGLSALAVVAVLVVCMTQLVLTLHFLTDVLAGLAGGAALALLAKHFAARAQGSPATTA